MSVHETGDAGKAAVGLTDEDMAELADSHSGWNSRSRGVTLSRCGACGEVLPCRTVRALAEIRRLRAAQRKSDDVMAMAGIVISAAKPLFEGHHRLLSEILDPDHEVTLEAAAMARNAAAMLAIIDAGQQGRQS